MVEKRRKEEREEEKKREFGSLSFIGSKASKWHAQK